MPNPLNKSPFTPYPPKDKSDNLFPERPERPKKSIFENLDYDQGAFNEEHIHTGEKGTGAKISYNDLEDLPATAEGFVDRGDPSAYDLTSPTIDGNWHDWDLSSIIPENTKLVKFLVKFRSSASTGEYIHLRKNGYTNGINQAFLMSYITTSYHHYEVTCPADSDRKVEYKINANLTNVSIAVLGWWK